MDVTQLRDLSLGAVAILAMAYIIVQLMRWQLEERKSWTAKVEEWGRQQREDRDVIIGVVKQITQVVQAFTDTVAQENKARSEQREAMYKTIRELTDGLQHVTDSLQKHRDRTEDEQAHKAR